MHEWNSRVASWGAVAILALSSTPMVAQQTDEPSAPEPHAPHAASEAETMWNTSVGAGWSAMGMAQLFPVVTVGAPTVQRSPLNATGWYITQPAVMTNLTSPTGRVVLRGTLNFEGLTQEQGEATFGGWGEGFIDRRHPHTLLHELVLSVNFGGSTDSAFSLSAGKGFAPYGTDDPMSRPGLKYPTNHHLSQVLERWFVSSTWLRGGWGVEASLFGGSAPDGPYDLSNIQSFGDSWSARISRRWPSGPMGGEGWEISASHARVVETYGTEMHDTDAHGKEGVEGLEEQTTKFWSGAVRYAGEGLLRYALLEGSTARGRGGDDFFSFLGEGRLRSDRHAPYARLEYATRPEYAREAETAPGFFRYDHAAEPIGATRWLITTLGYGFVLTDLPVSVWPFVEVQGFRVDAERGGVDPLEIFGDDAFLGLTLGARVFLGGEPMRMGSYGVLDSMTRMTSMERMEGM